MAASQEVDSANEGSRGAGPDRRGVSPSNVIISTMETPMTEREFKSAGCYRRRAGNHPAHNPVYGAIDAPDDPDISLDEDTHVATATTGAREKFAKPSPDPKTESDAPVTAIGLKSFLDQEFPPRESVFGPWLPTQGLAMVFAERGIGKTYFALNVAHAVATAGTYLGWCAPKRRRVLYLDGEMPAPTMQDRARAIAGFNPPDDLDVGFGWRRPTCKPKACRTFLRQRVRRGS